MEKGLSVAVHGGHQGDHILQVCLGSDGLLKVVRAGLGHPMLVGGAVDDPAFLAGGDLPGVDADGDPVHLTQVPQDGLLVGGGGVFPQRPHTAAGIAAQIVVHLEIDHRWGDHVEEIFDIRFLRRRTRHILFSGLCQSKNLLSEPAGGDGTEKLFARPGKPPDGHII